MRSYPVGAGSESGIELRPAAAPASQAFGASAPRGTPLRRSIETE
jgi:hypothetical protein